MGSGVFPAGAGGAGLDPVYRPAPLTPTFLPRSVYYEPRTRQFVLVDAAGNPVDMHPVTEIAVMRLTMEAGGSPSQPDLGTRLREIARTVAPARQAQAAYAEAARVLADLIRAGDLRLVSVVTDTSIAGSIKHAITIVNLRTSPPTSVPVSV